MTPQEQPDSQAGDELEAIIGEITIKHDQMIAAGLPDDEYFKAENEYYAEAKAAIEAYAERLAAKRAIAVLKNTCNSRGDDSMIYVSVPNRPPVKKSQYIKELEASLPPNKEKEQPDV